MATSIIVANLIGFLTGEWRKAPRSAVGTLCAGLGVLIAAIIILAIGNSRVSG
ncbi:MAG: hypothetical protein HYX78_14915 [Armatimonadetes bacterium]|nr:hypothetical protein [Armatimonadota bacterium]